jgi:hypothetical protein
MLNNTAAVLEGCLPDPDKINFVYRTNNEGKPGTVFDPVGIDHFELANKTYFWMQDGIILNNSFNATALNVFHDPEGSEGMQFGVDGVSLVTCPMAPNGPDIDAYTVKETPLHHDFGDGRRAFVGCGILPNTETASALEPDGYIYVYGYINGKGRSDLIVSRTRAEIFYDFSAWEFFTGSDWSKTLADSAIVAENISHELSVTPIREGKNKGQYLLVSQKNGAGHVVCCRLGDTPWGPFGPMIDLFHSDEWLAGEAIYTYNAKSHPHLSEPGTLLVSYNVNSLVMNAHVKNGDIYRPRFIVLKEV